MSNQLIDELIRQSEKLTPDERLILAARLIDSARKQIPDSTEHKHIRWIDAQGILSHPALGQDAQVVITQERKAASQKRTQ
jgi:hypothetical protein